MKKKAWIIVLIVIAAAAIAAFLILQNKDRLFGGSAQNESGGSVTVMQVKTLMNGGAAGTNRYSGVVETQKKEKVSLDTDKKLKETFVAEGSHVTEGDPLFSYDTESMDLEIQQKQIDLEKLDAEIANLNDQIAELTKQMNAANVSATDRLNYSAQILEAQTSVAQAEYDKKTKAAEISKLRAAMENAVVAAPMTGTVEAVADPQNIGVDAAYITIVADGDFRIKGTVSEQNIMNIAEGIPVIVRSRIDSEITWKGTITGLETKPETSSEGGSVAYSAYGDMSYSENTASKYVFYVELESMDGLLLGQHVTIEEDYGDAEALPQGVFVPDGFILFDEDAPYVWAAASGGASLEKRTVEVGAFLEEQSVYEILDGLTEEDYIAWPDENCAEGVTVVVNA